MQPLKSLANFLARTLLTPRAWLIYALTPLVLFIIFHLLGWRDYTAVLTGTAPLNVSTLIKAVLYLLTYFTTTILTPILLLGAIFHTALARLLPKN